MWYVGEKGSSTGMLMGRGALPLVSLSRYGGPTAWRIILSSSVPRYCKKIGSMRLKTNFCDRATCRTGIPCKICSCDMAALHSPGLFPDSLFLRNNEIAYYDFLQQPGDLIYISPWTPYFSVNLQGNISESTNIMPRLLTALEMPQMTCKCPESFGGLRKLAIRKSLVIVQEVPELTCSKRKCGKQFFTPEELDAHMVASHTYRCEFCGYSSTLKFNYTRHMTDHVSESRGQQLCECGAKVTSGGLARHRTTTSHRKKMLMLGVIL